MNFWIEVTNGMRWEYLLKEGIALDAPNKIRYRNFFKNVKSGDMALHYLTATLTRRKEKRSSVIGASMVASDPIIVEGELFPKIVAGCSNPLIFPEPISYSELRGLERKSAALSQLTGISMQRYLTQIRKSDFESILDIHPANRELFSKSALAEQR